MRMITYGREDNVIEIWMVLVGELSMAFGMIQGIIIVGSTSDG